MANQEQVDKKVEALIGKLIGLLDITRVTYPKGMELHNIPGVEGVNITRSPYRFSCATKEAATALLQHKETRMDCATFNYLLLFCLQGVHTSPISLSSDITTKAGLARARDQYQCFLVMKKKGLGDFGKADASTLSFGTTIYFKNFLFFDLLKYTEQLGVNTAAAGMNALYVGERKALDAMGYGARILTGSENNDDQGVYVILLGEPNQGGETESTAYLADANFIATWLDRNFKKDFDKAVAAEPNATKRGIYETVFKTYQAAAKKTALDEETVWIPTFKSST